MKLVSWQVIRGCFQSPLVTWRTSIRSQDLFLHVLHVWDFENGNKRYIPSPQKTWVIKIHITFHKDRSLEAEISAFSSGSCRRPRSAWLPTLEYAGTNGKHMPTKLLLSTCKQLIKLSWWHLPCASFPKSFDQLLSQLPVFCLSWWNVWSKSFGGSKSKIIGHLRTWGCDSTCLWNIL